MLLLLAPALITLGLLVPSPAQADEPFMPDPVQALDGCDVNPARCSAAPLFSPALLQDPSSIYFATPAQRVALQALEDQAVANALADHKRPVSDSHTMRTWGRYDVAAQLWALILQAVEAAPEARTQVQRDAVDWLTDSFRRKGERAVVNAGWEYLKWAGHLDANDPRPSTQAIADALVKFANSELTPVNYNKGTPEASTTGFCDYQPPPGFESQYTGNIHTEVLKRTTDTWCFPQYQCLNLLGCTMNTPSLESFVTWGDGRTTGNPADPHFLTTASSIKRATDFGIAAGAAVVGGAIMAKLIAAAVGSSALISVMFPLSWVSDFFVTVGGAWGAPQASYAAMAVGAVAFIITVVIIAVTIAILKGIEVGTARVLPDKLLALIDNAHAARPDLPAMLDDESQLASLFSVFVRALGPVPLGMTCDNSTKVSLIDDTAPQLCLNPPPWPATSADDPQFLVQQVGANGVPVGPSIRTDSLSHLQLLNFNPGPTQSPDLRVRDTTTQIRGGWFQSHTDYLDENLDPATGLGLHVSFTTFESPKTPETPTTQTAYLIPRDGSYKFLVLNGNALLGGFDPMKLDPDTCEAERICEVTDTLSVLDHNPASPTEGAVFRVKIVPRELPRMTIDTPAAPKPGVTSTLRATNTVPGFAPVTNQWYVEQPSWARTPCSQTQRFCGYDGPLTGDEVSYTWPTSGPTKVVLITTWDQGREVRTERTFDVEAVRPTISLAAPLGPILQPETFDLSGSITHAGRLDRETVTIDWGDGARETHTHEPSSMPVSCTNCSIGFTPRSDTRLDFSASHSFAEPGAYDVSITVRDHTGLSVERVIPARVMASQTLTLPSLADRTFGDGPVEVTAVGGKSGRPISLVSVEPDVCQTSLPTPGSQGGAVTATTSVTLVGGGTCRLVANQTASDFYEAAPEVVRTFGVAKATQQISFPALAERSYGDPDFEVTATGGKSGNPVVLTSLSSVCVLGPQVQGTQDGAVTVAAMVSIVSSGACIFDATQDGDHRYTAAPSVRRTMRVRVIAQSMTFPELSDRTFGDPVQAVTVVGGRSLEPLILTSLTPDVCTVVLPRANRLDGVATVTAYIDVLKAGRCELSAAQDGDSRYGRTDGQRAFDIAHATQTLTFPELTDRRYGDPAFDVTVVGGMSRQPVNLSSQTPGVCSVTSATPGIQSDGAATATATVKLVGAGRCTLEATQAGNHGYAAAAVQRSLDVAKALQTLEISASSGHVYGGPAFDVTVVGGKSGEPIQVRSATPGVCFVTSPVVGIQNGVSVATASVRPLAAGQCRFQATQAGNAWYESAPAVARVYAIAAAPMVITARDASMIVGGTAPKFDTLVSGLVAGDTRTVVTGLTCRATTSTGASVSSRTPVGTYPIRCSGGSAANYTITYRPGALRVGYAFANPAGGLFGTGVTTVKAGSKVAISWIIRDANGRSITTNASFRSLVAAPMTCGGTPPAVGGTVLAASPSAVTYDARSGSWSYGWKTPKGAQGCVAVTLTLASGQSHTARLQYR